MADFLEINAIIEIGAIGWIMTFTALVFSHRGETAAQFRMSFGRAMANFALDIGQESIGVFDNPQAGGVAGQAGGVGRFVLPG